MASALWRGGLVAVLVAGGVGCGAASMDGRPGADPMREIRALEAQIDDEEQAVTSADTECDRGCRAAASICEASERICAIAGELADMQSMGSCRRSEASCVEARRLVVERCACE